MLYALSVDRMLTNGDDINDAESVISYIKNTSFQGNIIIIIIHHKVDLQSRKFHVMLVCLCVLSMPLSAFFWSSFGLRRFDPK